MTNYEKETIFNFNEDERTANIYTYNRKLQNQLAVLEVERPAEVTKDPRYCGDGAVSYTIPKGWIKIRPNRILSDEQLAKKQAQLKKNLNKSA